MTALISAFVTMILGHLFPLIILKKLEKREWYIFTHTNEYSRALARHLLEEDSQNVIIFLDNSYQHISKVHLDNEGEEHVWMIPQTIDELVEKHPKVTKHLFCIDKKSLQNIKSARDAIGLGCKIYCITDVGMDILPSYIVAFQEKDIVARKYWMDYPLAKEEKNIVIIGCGNYGEKILEKALFTNIIDPGQSITYHVYGNSKHFQMCHDRLRGHIQNDRVLFYNDDWKSDRDLLRHADRIIICTDDEIKNLAIEMELHRFFAVEGKIYIRLTNSFHNGKAVGTEVINEFCTRFGTAADTFTPALVIRQEMETIPHILNDFYRESNYYDGTTWNALSEILRQYYMAMADHLITKIRIVLQSEIKGKINADLCRQACEKYLYFTAEQVLSCRELEHMRWCRFYLMYNWEYGPKRDSMSRQHPLLRPFEDLREDETLRHDKAWQVLSYVADHLKFPENQ